MNSRIRHWLDSGHAVEALVGRPGYFVRDVDFVDEHDRVLVTDQLLTWAEDTNNVEGATRAVEGAIDELVRDVDLRGAFSTMWTYAVVAADRGATLPISPNVLASTIGQIRASSPEIVPAAILDELEQRLGIAPRIPGNLPGQTTRDPT
ncbi:MAG: hypothetical protein L0221_11040 [Chloroflexi bacterium]|nr:hypothetical protein [Chloroflexota bacterium]